MNEREILTAVEHVARSRIADGFEALVEAAVAAEASALHAIPRDRQRRIEAMVEDMVEAMAAEAFGPEPERLVRAQRLHVRMTRACERARRLLRKAGIAPQVRFEDVEGPRGPSRRWLANQVHGHWLDEAGLWEQLEHLFRLAENQRHLSERYYGADHNVLAQIRKHAE